MAAASKGSIATGAAQNARKTQGKRKGTYSVAAAGKASLAIGAAQNAGKTPGKRIQNFQNARETMVREGRDAQNIRKAIVVAQKAAKT